MILLLLHNNNSCNINNYEKDNLYVAMTRPMSSRLNTVTVHCLLDS